MRKHIIYFMTLVMLVYSCQKEISVEIGGTGDGTLQIDAGGDCLPKTVNGAYVATTTLVATTNTITVDVNVTTTGTYTVYTDTVNGYFFRATGTFMNLGMNTVTLRGNGTPLAAGTNNFIVHFKTSVCDIQVTVLPAGTGAAVFTLAGSPNACTGAVVNGSYAVGVALNASNTATISVNVTTVGTYAISTTATNGMTFSKSGSFAATGVQTVTLNGSGTPVTAGNTTIPVTAGTSNCTFVVNVGTAAVGTLGGGPAPGACTPSTVNGTYTVGTPLVAGNTVQVQVNVTTAGVYSITTNTNAGFSFSKSGTFAATGPQNVILDGTGTPTAAGNQTFTVTFGTSTCTFVVNVSAGSGAVGTLGGGPAPGACTPSTVNGTYTVGTILTSANTVQVQVNVTTPGTYNITTNTVTGFSFSKSGSFAATGPQNVILDGTGTPSTAGNQTFTVTFGTSTCTFVINVAGGGSAFTANCSTAVPDGLYEATSQLNCSNIVDIDVNVTALGPYNITTTATNGMTFSASGTFTVLGVQTITLVGSGTPTNGGTFNIPMPGTTPCTFSLTVDPVPPVGFQWNFTVTNAPATKYQGQTDDAQLIPNPPVVGFLLQGSNSLGTDNLTFVLSDANGTIANGETYSTSAAAGNQAGFQYTLATSANCADTYSADPTITGVTIIFTVQTHNTVTKTITGIFSGTAKNMAGQTITITLGNFTGTYL